MFTYAKLPSELHSHDPLDAYYTEKSPIPSPRLCLVSFHSVTGIFHHTSTNTPFLTPDINNLGGVFSLAENPHIIVPFCEADDALSVAVAEKFYCIVFTGSEVGGL